MAGPYGPLPPEPIMPGPIMAPMSVRVTSTTAPVSAGVAHEGGQSDWIGPPAANTAVVPTPSTTAVNAMIKINRSR